MRPPSHLKKPPEKDPAPTGPYESSPLENECLKNAVQCTGLVTDSVRMSHPVETSQSLQKRESRELKCTMHQRTRGPRTHRTVLSLLPLMMRLPLGLTATLQT